MKGPAISVSRALHGIVIAIAAPVAAAGLTLACFIRNVVLSPEMFLGAPGEHQLRGTSLTDLGGAALLALLMVLWGFALVQFVRSDPRSPISIAVGLLAVAVFAVCARQTLIFAYPVCNPF